MTSHTGKGAAERNDDIGPKSRPLWCATEMGTSAKPANCGAVRVIFSVSWERGDSMAGREGFEPSMGLHPYCFSRAAHSTALPPARLVLTRIEEVKELILAFIEEKPTFFKKYVVDVI